jgi:hypothetical protein
MSIPRRSGASARRIVLAVAIPAVALGVAAARPAVASDAEPGAVAQQPPVAVTARVIAADGGSRLVVRLVHRRGVHTWPNRPVMPESLQGFEPIATTFTVLELHGGVASAAGAVWPAGRAVSVEYGGAPLSIPAYAGTIEAAANLVPAAGAGAVSGALAVTYQPCDKRYCYPPRTDTVRFRSALP